MVTNWGSGGKKEDRGGDEENETLKTKGSRRKNGQAGGSQSHKWERKTVTAVQLQDHCKTTVVKCVCVRALEFSL